MWTILTVNWLLTATYIHFGNLLLQSFSTALAPAKHGGAGEKGDLATPAAPGTKKAGSD